MTYVGYLDLFEPHGRSAPEQTISLRLIAVPATDLTTIPKSSAAVLEYWGTLQPIIVDAEVRQDWWDGTGARGQGERAPGEGPRGGRAPLDPRQNEGRWFSFELGGGGPSTPAAMHTTLNFTTQNVPLCNLTAIDLQSSVGTMIRGRFRMDAVATVSGAACVDALPSGPVVSVCVLSVGQGLAVRVVIDDEAAIWYDLGWNLEGMPFDPAVRPRAGDAVVLSHWDYDHIGGGLEQWRERRDEMPRVWIVPSVRRTISPVAAELLGKLLSAGFTVKAWGRSPPAPLPNAPPTPVVGIGPHITIARPEPWSIVANDSGIVMTFHVPCSDGSGPAAVLLVGDARYLHIPRFSPAYDFLAVKHHGSKHGIGQPPRARPGGVAVYSHGGQHKHVHPESFAAHRGADWLQQHEHETPKGPKAYP